MLIELGVVDQRHQAVLEVFGGAAIVEVAERYGVSRQSVHRWLRRYARSGLGGLADHSSRPANCPHQMPARIEARIVEMRLAHPSWGARTIAFYLRREGLEPPPARSSVYRALVRHHLIDPKRRRRRREDYCRWERSRAMELWQMDVMGGVFLADGSELKIITGIDDHSRFCLIARLAARATARPVCEALIEAMRTHGRPEQILTDNGRVFTGRFGRGRGEVLFDRICREAGIRHLLTAPHSPTTTGKVERFHRTVRSEFLGARHFASLEEAQAALDAWVAHYNGERPHQGIGMVVPARRFALARPRQAPAGAPGLPDVQSLASAQTDEPQVTRLVGRSGKISLCGAEYRVGAWLAGETVEVTMGGDSLVKISHRDVLIATFVRRHRPGADPARERHVRGRARPGSLRPAVLRMVDTYGFISFAGTGYHAGKRYARQQVEVRLAGDKVEIWQAETLIRTHAARHDQSKEHGAFATPGGRPHKHKTAADSDPAAVTEVLEPIRNTGTGT